MDGEMKVAEEAEEGGAGAYRRQDLRLGDDAVGEAVLPALGGHLRPGDLETRDPLVGGHPGHPPQEAAGDVPLADGEGGRQVLRLGQNLGVSRSCAGGGGGESKGGVGETRTHERKGAREFTACARASRCDSGAASLRAGRRSLARSSRNKIRCARSFEAG